MSYTDVIFWLFAAVLCVIYYIFPRKMRWLILLAGSMVFYLTAAGTNALAVLCVTIVVSYLFGRLLEKHKSRLLLTMAIVFSASPLLAVKFLDYTNLYGIGLRTAAKLIRPLGLAFYTMQLIAYLADIYRNRIEPEKNPLKYALFISFFPQIIQGPIPRFSDLAPQLEEGHSFDEDNLIAGFQMIVWGFFLKMMIADKCAIAVNTIFDNYRRYFGCEYVLAGILYSLQLYTDFLACTKLSQGAARIFGIRLKSNFLQPYQAVSIQDFWRRWHVSLSSWLRDYIYIPLGGNRKGTVRKYVNLMLTFLVSGFWHGGNWTFVLWGVLHGVCQIIEALTYQKRKKLCFRCHTTIDSEGVVLFHRIVTLVLVGTGWMLFRAPSIEAWLHMLKSIFTVWNPWRLSGSALIALGLAWEDWVLLLLSVLLLFKLERMQKTITIKNWLNARPLVVRYVLLIGAVVLIWNCGTYGYGAEAQNFIYGGF